MAKTSLPASVWKELVEGLSAYQVAVKNGYTGTEVEWLESLIGPAGQAGTNGIIDSIVAGTGIEVDDTDPANPIVSATGGGGGGGGGGMTLFGGVLNAAAYDSSANCFVGNRLVPVNDIDIYGISMQFSNAAANGQQYKLVAVRAESGTGLIHEVVESDVYTLSSADDFNSGKNLTLFFNSPVQCRRTSPAQNWYIGVMRVDGEATATTSVGRSTSSPSQQWQFFRHLNAFVSTQQSLTVGGTLTQSTGSGHYTFIMYAGRP